eukprot:TRINITY_DN1815_c1_g1_i1.p1 TRINITY_DN1815_c1_g1~~TRINITY_DN1815_c1_g1_i1.p1  ORF type:complete len:420 (-),score=117.67 TRINITY_DN1815_c1_g1_i1:39-1298(-)
MHGYKVVTEGGDKLEETADDIKPVETIQNSTLSEEELAMYEDAGYNVIADGKLAVVLLAGGQGSRLGSSDPKGMYDVGLPSGKTLFQIQAERILRLEELTFKKTGKKPSIIWYILTSSSTDVNTKNYFRENNFFGLREQQIRFFMQGDFPCLTNEGKIIMKSNYEIARAPNGNGGLWIALKSIISSIEEEGIEWFATYPVDNILVKIADPVMLGICDIKKVDSLAKVVPKSYPEESVGVVAMRNGKYTVLEYSEIDEERRYAINPDTNQLLFNAANLAIFNFSVSFVKSFTENHIQDLPFHVARRNYRYTDESGEQQSIPSMKLEFFNFDILNYAENVVAYETTRDEDFSPLKNADSAGKDCPTTCREHLSDLHKRYFTKAGGSFEGEGLFEISPLVSYAGEGLEEYISTPITLPYHLN